MATSCGPLILVGSIVSFGFFEVVGKVRMLISDIEGDKTISYTLTLPVSSRTLFCYIGILLGTDINIAFSNAISSRKIAAARSI